jgi:hypothetical protein
MSGLLSAATRLLRLRPRGRRLFAAEARGLASPIESRRELSARYMRELSELVDDRRISAAVAEKVVSDMFEPDEAGEPRRVRLAIWQSYVRDRTGEVGLRLVGGECDLAYPDGEPKP